MVENTWEEMGENQRALAASAFGFEKLKRAQSSNVVGGKSSITSQKVIKEFFENRRDAAGPKLDHAAILATQNLDFFDLE